MQIGDRVRVTQNAAGHAGDVGMITAILDAAIMAVDFGVCAHPIEVDMLRLVDGPHAYSPQTLVLLDMCLSDFREYADEIDPHAIPDFEALIAHVKARLA